MTDEEFKAGLIRTLRQRTAMPRKPKRKSLGPQGKRVDRELRRMMGLLPNPPPRPPQVITEEDVERALAEYRATRRLSK